MSTSPPSSSAPSDSRKSDEALLVNSDIIQRFLDDEMDADQRKQLENQLEQEPAVREEIDELKKLLSVVGELPEVQAPPGFYERLSKRVRRRSDHHPPPWSIWLSLPVQLIATVLIIGIGVVFLLSTLDQKPTRESLLHSKEASETGADSRGASEPALAK